jgi:hypothetical protein
MTDMDFQTFSVAFDRIVTGFRVKLKPKEAKDLPQIYFRALRAYPLDAVLLAGKGCVDKGKKFPQVADWLEALVVKGSAPANCPDSARQMRVSEIDDHERAAAMRYEDEPCLCAECEHAGVMYRPLRFVPTLQGDSYEQAFNPRRGKVEIVGHWAHGDELKRWYVARDHFFALAKAKPQFARVLALVGRQPGEDDDT